MDDLISRKWLMECVEEGWIKFDAEKDENRFIHLVRDIAPSAQPERPKGEWILQDTSYWRPTHAGDIQVNRVNLKCSRCGHRLAKAQKVKNFCPNCGTDMRGATLPPAQ